MPEETGSSRREELPRRELTSLGLAGPSIEGSAVGCKRLRDPRYGAQFLTVIALPVYRPWNDDMVSPVSASACAMSVDASSLGYSYGYTPA